MDKHIEASTEIVTRIGKKVKSETFGILAQNMAVFKSIKALIFHDRRFNQIWRNERIGHCHMILNFREIPDNHTLRNLQV